MAALFTKVAHFQFPKKHLMCKFEALVAHLLYKSLVFHDFKPLCFSVYPNHLRAFHGTWKGIFKTTGRLDSVNNWASPWRLISTSERCLDRKNLLTIYDVAEIFGVMSLEQGSEQQSEIGEGDGNQMNYSSKQVSTNSLTSNSLRKGHILGVG